jgi:hypothetical protein
MSDYQDYQVETSSLWLRGQHGTDWEYAFGLVKQGFLQAAKNAIKARFPELAPGDALDPIGETLQIERAFARDDNEYIAMLMRAWASWGEAGTRPGMMDVLTHAGRLLDVDVKEAWDWNDGNPSWFFTVTCAAPTPWNTDPLADGQWQDPGTWNDGGVWAGGIPVVDRARLKALITKRKPTHSVCAAVIVVLRPGDLFYDINSGTYDSGETYDDAAASLYINMQV